MSRESLKSHIQRGGVKIPDHHQPPTSFQWKGEHSLCTIQTSFFTSDYRHNTFLAIPSKLHHSLNRMICNHKKLFRPILINMEISLQGTVK